MTHEYVVSGCPTKFIHINEFALRTKHSYPAIHALLKRSDVGDRGRQLRCWRDESTIWIPEAEVAGYPFVKGSNVYHYDAAGKKVLCVECTFGVEICNKNAEALKAQLPE